MSEHPNPHTQPNAPAPWIDYLRLRLPDEPATRRRVLDLLGSCQDRATGWRAWYDCSARAPSGATLAWCRHPDRARAQGILIELPSAALAAAPDAAAALLDLALDRGRVTRLDVAADDRRGLLTYDRLMAAVAAGACVTRWRNVTEHRSYSPAAGWTIYWGRTRDAQSTLRVYDKAAQQRTAGPWVRLELQTAGDLAHALAGQIHDRGLHAAIEQLNRRIRFTAPEGPPADPRRRPPAPWWQEFLADLRQGPALAAPHPKPADPAPAPDPATDWLARLIRQYWPLVEPRHLALIAIAAAVAEHDLALPPQPDPPPDP